MSTVQFISGKAALAEFIEGIRQGSADVIDESGYNASKALRNSLSTEVQDIPGATTGELFGLSHWKFVGNGRGPGKRPPTDPLIQWALDKGIASDDKEARTIGFLVARRIGAEGSKAFRDGGKNIFVQQVEAAQPKVPDVLRAFLNDNRNSIVSQFTKAFAA